MSGQQVLGALAALGPILAAYVTWMLGRRRAHIDMMNAVTDRDEAETEKADVLLRQSAALRQELRQVNASQAQQIATQAQQIASLTSDNTKVHQRIHDLANEVMVLQGGVETLTHDRDTCREDLAEVLRVVDALMQGRNSMMSRIRALEDSGDVT